MFPLTNLEWFLFFQPLLSQSFNKQNKTHSNTMIVGSHPRPSNSHIFVARWGHDLSRLAWTTQWSPCPVAQVGWTTRDCQLGPYWFKMWKVPLGITRWWLQVFSNFFTPIPGEMFQFEDYIFQMGWFKHQLVQYVGKFFVFFLLTLYLLNSEIFQTC